MVALVTPMDERGGLDMAAFDRLLDMLRTAVNVTGDATVSCLVAKSENALDEEIFSRPSAQILADEAAAEAANV